VLDPKQIEALLHLLTKDEEVDLDPRRGVAGIAQLLGKRVDSPLYIIEARRDREGHELAHPGRGGTLGVHPAENM